MSTPPTSPPDPSHPAPAAAGDEVDRVVSKLALVPFGLAVACVTGAVLFALTAAHTWLLPESADDRFVWLLGGNFLPGMEPTSTGAFVALIWGLVWGFLMGCFIAFARNGIFALALRWVLWRERLRRNSRVLEDLM